MKTTIAKCPSCNAPIILSARPTIHPANAPRGIMQSVAPAGPVSLPAEPSEWEKTTPVGRLQPVDVTTAVYDASVVMIIIMILSGIGIFLVYLIFDFYIWWEGAPIVGFCAFAIRYFGGLNLAKGLLEIAEYFTSAPDQPEPEIIKAEPEEIQLHITHADDQGKVIKRERPMLPNNIPLESFYEWCQQVSSGAKGLTEAEWAGKGLPFGKTAYRDLQSFMAKRGVIEKSGNAKNSKWQLALGSRAALKGWAEMAKRAIERRQTDRQTDNWG